jgi:hypothetical protein
MRALDGSPKNDHLKTRKVAAISVGHDAGFLWMAKRGVTSSIRESDCNR